jgi:heme-degrading monooxygenase HmoA
MSGTLIASFHLVRERPGRSLAALTRLGTDRPALARTEGLVFWRLLGTGRGSDTGLGADLRRTALFAVWEDDAALDRFLDRSPIAQRWQVAAEAYTVRLRALGGHGTWRGFDVVERVTPGADDGGPVAFVTRATVRARRWRPFVAAGHRVSAEAAAAPGLLAVAGIGEAPLGRQATFSLWASAAAATTFASTSPHHREAVRRTRAEGWYGEELFAHFQPYRSQGTWDGRDPLAT